MLLNSRRKWIYPQQSCQVGNIVLLRDEDAPRNKWALARISKTYPSRDGLIRKVQVITAKSGPRRTYDRPYTNWLPFFHKKSEPYRQTINDKHLRGHYIMLKTLYPCNNNILVTKFLPFARDTVTVYLHIIL